MDRNLAEQLTQKLFGLDDALNEIAWLAETLTDKEEKIAFRRAVAELIGGIYTDMLTPIFRQYPDLDQERKSTT